MRRPPRPPPGRRAAPVFPADAALFATATAEARRLEALLLEARRSGCSRRCDRDDPLRAGALSFSRALRAVRRRYGADFRAATHRTRTAGRPCYRYGCMRWPTPASRARRTLAVVMEPGAPPDESRSLEVVDAPWVRDARYRAAAGQAAGVTVVALLTSPSASAATGDLLAVMRCCSGRSPTGIRIAGEGVGEADCRKRARQRRRSGRPSSMGPHDTVFEDMAAYMAITADLTAPGNRCGVAAGVSPPFFDILRVQPASAGRSGATKRRPSSTASSCSPRVVAGQFGSDPARSGAIRPERRAA